MSMFMMQNILIEFCINQIESIDSKNDIFIPKTEITRPDPKKDERDFFWGVIFY